MENFIKRALSTFLLAPISIFALMEGYQVVEGWADPNNSLDPKVQNIQYKNKTVINCSKFNIAKDETVHFINKDKNTSVLCRVTGKNASMIEGTLKADGRLVLINPYSIVFRETAFVDAHQFFASTLDMRDEDFLRDKYKFSLDSGAEGSCIVNLGKINAAQSVFMAPELVNRGTIQGKVALLGGKDITINFEGDEKFSFVIDKPLQSGFAEIAGTIEAKGKDVLIRHRVAEHVIRSVINANDLIEATAMVRENGIIRLVAKSSIEVGNLEVKGRVVENAARIILGKEDVQRKKLVGKAEIEGNKELRWKGGEITLPEPQDSKSFKIVQLEALLRSNEINLYEDVLTKNTKLIFDGPVIARKNIAISSPGGKILFTASVNSDSISRNLFLSTESGSFKAISLRKPIGDIHPFCKLQIDTGELELNNIGGKSQGAKQLNVHASQSTKCTGTDYRTEQQTWYSPKIHLDGEGPTRFSTEGSSLTFTEGTHLNSKQPLSLNFETKGGEFNIPNLSCSGAVVKIDTGKGNVTLGDISECSLNVYGGEVRFKGKIDATTLSIEAHDNILNSELVTPSSIHTKGDLILNAKNGGIGEISSRIKIQAEGKLRVGAKESAFFEGKCLHNLPYDLANRPVTTHILITEQDGKTRDLIYSREAIEKIMAKEEKDQLKSLASDLDHLIPHGFVDERAFTPQRAPLFYLRGIPRLIGTGEDESEAEKTER